MTRQYEYNKKWRLRNPEKRQAENQKRNNESQKYATNSYLPWSQEEDRQILAADRPSDSEMVKVLGRSYQAISQRRMKLVNDHGKTCEPRSTE